MNLDRGEIVLIDVQFHQQPGSKIRPAVVVLDTGDGDFVAVPITSRQRTGPYEVSIEQWRERHTYCSQASPAGPTTP